MMFYFLLIITTDIFLGALQHFHFHGIFGKSQVCQIYCSCEVALNRTLVQQTLQDVKTLFFV